MMHHSISLLALALSVSSNAQNFQGSPGGGSRQGKILDFPQCAKSCITTPPSNFVNEFAAFCNLVRSKDCCITNACGQEDTKVTHQISHQICAYIGDNVPAFTCTPSKVTSTAPSSTSHHTTSTVSSITHTTSSSHSASSTHSTSTKLSTSTKHSTSSAHSSSTKHSSSTTKHSSSSTKHSTSPTPSTLHTSTRSTSHSSQKPSSTPSKTPQKANSSTPTSLNASAPLSTLSAYNGFAGAYCCTEGTTGRALDKDSLTSPEMTIEYCLDFCERSGWGWAGVENGNQCFCGDKITNGGASTSASTCNEGCAGNSTENCGGKNALSVYESG